MPRRLRSYLPAAILFVGCGLVWNAHTQSSIPLEGSLGSVLSDLRGYEVSNQKISAEEQTIAGMTDYSARAYHRDGVIAFTTFVSYYDRQTQGRTIHSPRNCLPGAGWEIISGGSRSVMLDGASRPVNRYVLKKGNSTAVAYYWYQGRGRITANEYVVKWNLLRDAALIGRTEEALVRVVVPVLAASSIAGPADERAAMAQADVTAQDISTRLITDLDRVLPD